MNEKAIEFMRSHLNKWVGVDIGIPEGDKTAVQILPDTQVYIVAGEHRHAEWFAHKIGLSKKQWRYVEDAYRLQGATGVIIFYETFWRNRNAPEIYDLAQILIKRNRLVEVKQRDVLHE